MNDCEQAVRLSAYHDGELPAAARAEMERHIRLCPTCAAELERLRELTRMARQAPAIAIPPGVLERLHQRVDPLRARAINRWAEALAAIAAMILVACTAGLATQDQGGGAPAGIDIMVTQAVAQPAAESASEVSDEQLASWMVQDLSGTNEHD